MDWKRMPDGKEKYAAYLCSREWAVKRRAVEARCGRVCERCRLNDMDCVHHLTYARKYNERISDLAGWCDQCHAFVHGKSDFDPDELFEIIQSAYDSVTFDCPVMEAIRERLLSSDDSAGDVLITSLLQIRRIRQNARLHSVDDQPLCVQSRAYSSVLTGGQ